MRSHLNELTLYFSHLVPQCYFCGSGDVGLPVQPLQNTGVKKLFVELNQYCYRSRKKIWGKLRVASQMETEYHLTLQVYITIPLFIISTLNEAEVKLWNNVTLSSLQIDFF